MNETRSGYSRGLMRAAVIGAGYWGPNLARNFTASPDWELAGIVDLDQPRAAQLAAAQGGVPVFRSIDELLDTADVDAVAIATPAHTHHGIALTALKAGKHVLVEKPLADSRLKGLEMVEEAEQRGLVLMADHTYCYTPAVLKIRELIADGSLGDILFIDSVRINLGLVQPDVDVFWDLAPHDLSILDFILPEGLRPVEVAAHGADPLGTGHACIGHLTFALPNDAMAHVHVNWLSPTKIRQLVVGGSRRTLVWDDLNPQQRLSVYDRGVSLERQSRSSPTGRPRPSPTGWVTPGRRHCPNTRRWARWWPNSPTASGSSGPPGPAARPACGFCPCWRQSATASARTEKPA